MRIVILIVSIFLNVGVYCAPCKMSPLTRYLSDEQQQTLHQLIVSARNSGADEEMVKDSMDEYLSQVLSPEKLIKFKIEHDQFEEDRKRIGKRSVEEKEKPEPVKVFDIIDQYNQENYKKYHDFSNIF